MITVTITMLFLVHLMGCLFFLVAKFDDLHPKTWVARSDLIYEQPLRQYLFAVNWALQTLTTVGYGEIGAVTGAEQITALLWMAIGVGFYSFTIGNLSSIISDIDIKAAILQEKIQAMQGFVKRNPNLPIEIEQKIRRFLQNNHNEHLQKFDQEKLINELPSNLKSQIVAHTHGEIVRQIRFLDNKNQEFIWQMLPLFSQMKVYKDDALYGQNDPAEEIFFIIKGRVKQYYNIFCHQPMKDARNVPVNITVEGSYFGDVEVILNQGRDVRKVMAVAKVESQLLVVTKKTII